MTSKPIDYEHLTISMDKYYISYYLLLYSLSMTYNHLSGVPYKCTCIEDFALIDLPENQHDGSKWVMLEKSEIKLLIENYSKKTNVDYYNGHTFLTRVGAHFLRTKVLNSFYELIKNYMDGKYGKEEFAKLHNLDWFRVLTVLRNSASHADNYNKAIYFPNHKTLPVYPDVIEWKTIKIINKQTEPIRYNDAEVIGLLTHIMNFFKSNYND